MATETEIMERIHNVETMQTVYASEMKSMERIVSEIQKTLKAVEVKVTLATGAFLAIEIFSKFWR